MLTGRFKVHGFWLKTDGTNDPTVPLEDKNNTTGKTGETILDQQTFDASQYGLNGVIFSEAIACSFGVYTTITCGGTCVVYLLYS